MRIVATISSFAGKGEIVTKTSKYKEGNKTLNSREIICQINATLQTKRHQDKKEEIKYSQLTHVIP